MTAAVTLHDVSCLFRTGKKSLLAVDRVSLEVQPGEFFTLLGPSGSGKTTCLRMIGGFTLPTSGSITIDGVDMSRQPPYARPVNTVFQDYALFPHMSILDNVAYALMVRGVDRARRERRAHELLETVQLPDVAQRKPVQLSGGQRQRVALARALISEPKVLLLDEPLGALDLKLREQLQSELKSLQRKLGITFVFVTHDQHEALSMSDRIGVFNGGRLEQTASPADLYHRPQTRFVAEFVGATNVLLGQDAMRLGHAGAVMIRPEQIALHLGAEPASGAAVRASGVVQEVLFFGSFSRVRVQLAPGTASLQVDVPVHGSTRMAETGDTVHLSWAESSVHPIDDAPSPAS